MSQLFKLNIIHSEDNIAGTLFNKLFPNIFNIGYNKPSEYIKSCWDTYLRHPGSNNNQNGKIFEYLLATLLIRENILPIYLSAKVAFVPNVIYDLMFYSNEYGPICFSAKTSLRERYKQADLEAIALKYVHRKALNYLITLDTQAAKNAKLKIKEGDIIGLNDVVVATSTEFDNLIDRLTKIEFSIPPTVEVITSKFIVTKENVQSLKRST